MFHEYLKNFILCHDNWESILTSDPYNLSISRKGDYIIFKYSQFSSDFTLKEVREARGIIFYEPTWDCVCRAFDKFGNYGESYVDKLEWGTGVSVQEKIDGSLIKIFYHDGWRVSTNGGIDAKDSKTGSLIVDNFYDLFELAIKNYYDNLQVFFESLDKSYTYMFEVVSPYTRVVIPYKKIDTYYLGCRNMKTMEEKWIPPININANRPHIYNLHSLEDVLSAASLLPWDEEGYVCVDRNFNRCKIKSPLYVKAHYARLNNNVSKRDLIQVILSNEIDEFLIYAEDYKETLYQIKDQMDSIKNRYDELQRILPLMTYDSYGNYVDTDQKTYAKYVMQNLKGLDRSFAFEIKKGTAKEQIFEKWSENKWYDELEKKQNGN